MKPIEVGSLVTFQIIRPSYSAGLYSFPVIGIVLTIPSTEKWSDLHKSCKILSQDGTIVRLMTKDLLRID